MQELLNDLPDDLRRRALTHPAFAAARAESFERLEFLGDSVLGLAITDELYRRFPDLDEGELTRMRAKVVSRDSCAVVARESGLGEAAKKAGEYLIGNVDENGWLAADVAEIVREAGVPEGAIHLEDRSTTTRERGLATSHV